MNCSHTVIGIYYTADNIFRIPHEKKRMTTRLLTCLSVLMFFSTSIMAENWPSWRGPLGTSIAQPGDYPTQWTTTGDNTKNLKWKVQVPGKGSSTPAVWGDNIFVTYNLPDGKNSLMSLNREGEKRWSVEFGAATPGKYGIASGANPCLLYTSPSPRDS